MYKSIAAARGDETRFPSARSRSSNLRRLRKTSHARILVPTRARYTTGTSIAHTVPIDHRPFKMWNAPPFFRPFLPTCLSNVHPRRQCVQSFPSIEDIDYSTIKEYIHFYLRFNTLSTSLCVRVRMFIYMYIYMYRAISPLVHTSTPGFIIPRHESEQ